ncbi:MAG TPA: methyltransferase [Ohtaekwangia sp.]
MKQALLQLIAKPWHIGVRWYLSKPRPYTYKDICMTVSPGVFHPGFFFSTRLVCKFLETQNLERRKFLELGSGSGFLSIVAARMGALVTACDINPNAVNDTRLNAQSNKVHLDVIESDLFNSIPQQTFDWIIINPPYYPADPKSDEQHAWYCGLHHQYFEKLFGSMNRYITPESKILMVLSDVCDMEKIKAIALQHHWTFDKILEKNVWADGKNYLFWIRALE